MNFIIKNLWLIALALGSGGMLLWPMLRRGSEVSPHEAVMLINHAQALVLDVREDAEFAAGHVPDARHIPLGQLAARLSELEKWKNKPIVVNCKSGMRASNACALLQRSGFSRVNNLAGGIAAWQSAKLPISKD
jgi:rhodanese-related sulfurtransferase